MDHSSTAHDPPSGAFNISLANEQERHAVDESRLVEAARAILRDSAFTSATVSIAVVDDATIHDFNRRYLKHDWPTDVLSFVLEDGDSHLEGEVIVSADTAAISAAEAGWPAAAEQLLYVVHGMLHLVGYRENTPDDLRKMRDAEARYLLQFGLECVPRNGEPIHDGATAS